jgi:hypothetical protein
MKYVAAHQTEYPREGMPTAYPFEQPDVFLENRTYSEGSGSKLRCIMEGTDFLTTVSVTPSTLPGDLLFTLPVDPHVGNNTRLQLESRNWQKYFFKRFDVCYIPVSGTDEDGSIIGTYFTDPKDVLSQNDPENITRAYGNFENVEANQVWQHTTYNYDCVSWDADYYTEERMNENQRLTEQAVFQLISQGQQTVNGSIGVLALTYRIEFTQPQAPDSVVGSVVSYIGSSPVAASSELFGSTEPLRANQSNINLDSELVNSSWRWYLPYGHWIVKLAVLGDFPPGSQAGYNIGAGLRADDPGNVSIAQVPWPGYVGSIESVPVQPSQISNTWYIQSIDETENWIDFFAFFTSATRAFVTFTRTVAWDPIPSISSWRAQRSTTRVEKKLEELTELVDKLTNGKAEVPLLKPKIQSKPVEARRVG